MNKLKTLIYNFLLTTYPSININNKSSHIYNFLKSYNYVNIDIFDMFDDEIIDIKTENVMIIQTYALIVDILEKDDEFAYIQFVGLGLVFKLKIVSGSNGIIKVSLEDLPDESC